MPEELILVSPPVQAAGRSYYPVVRVRHENHTNGGWMSATPVAILIEEEGSWYYAGLEENTLVADYLASCR